MKLWLDDIRDPMDFVGEGWHWVRTAEEAVAWIMYGGITEASLDHDLGLTQLDSVGIAPTGYDVVCWLEQYPQSWPVDGVHVHTQNPVGRERMQRVIDQHYKKSS